MADLVRARTEIECVIEDFAQAGANGEQRREEVSQQLQAVQERITDVQNQLDTLSEELDNRLAAEREAKET